jgi:RNA polymerase sigma-70 factor (ECF subfamily)
MGTTERDALEHDVRDAGNYDDAATLAIKGYGAEIYGLLASLHHDEAAASDVSVVCENVWRGLSGFAWGSTLRPRVYTIARHASLGYRTREKRLQILLVLRVDRDLAWSVLARIMLGDGEDAPTATLDEDPLKREAARLRKRLQLVKEKRIELGRKEGLIHPKG